MNNLTCPKHGLVLQPFGLNGKILECPVCCYRVTPKPQPIGRRPLTQIPKDVRTISPDEKRKIDKTEKAHIEAIRSNRPFHKEIEDDSVNLESLKRKPANPKSPTKLTQ